MHYSLIDLKLFVAVADAGNVSRGGASCFLAPSSASLRIKQLEHTLGTRLFLREARGVSLTRAGQVMLEHCRRCLAELEQMHANLAPYAEGVRAQVTIFANSSAIASFLPRDLQTFLRDYPEVRISMEERLSQSIVAAVAEGRADVGVVTWDDEHPELVFLPYRQDEVVMLVPEGDPLAACQSVAFLDCLSRPFVSLQSGAAIHTFIVGQAAALGHHIDVRIQVAGFAAVVAMVRSGAGIGMVPCSVLQSINCDGVRVLTLREKWAVRPLKLCTRRNAAASAVYVGALLRQLCPQADAPAD